MKFEGCVQTVCLGLGIYWSEIRKLGSQPLFLHSIVGIHAHNVGILEILLLPVSIIIKCVVRVVVSISVLNFNNQ